MLSNNPAHIGFRLNDNTVAILHPNGILEVVGEGTVEEVGKDVTQLSAR